MHTYMLKLLNYYYWMLDKLSKQRYIKDYPRYLRRLGIDIPCDPGDSWISPRTFFDSVAYDAIHIGCDCTISFDVAILVHDYSVNTALRAVDEAPKGRHKMKVAPVRIGDNCFVGARALLLPGTQIGSNSVVGAGAVVRGVFAPNSVIAGNPARVVSDIEQLAQKARSSNQLSEDTR